MIKIKNKSAFTLVELLVVIAIIGLIATLSVIALGNARSKSRDSKRVSDIKQVQTALELFFSDQGRYPTATEWNTGSLYATSIFGTTTYMARIPTVTTGGICSNDYSYAPNFAGDDYTINFCLESNTGSLTKGLNFAKAASLGKSDPSLVGWWNFDEGVGSTLYNYSTAYTNGSIIGSGINYSINARNGNPALYFDGTVGSYISLPDPGGENYSFFFWFKPDQSWVSGYARMTKKGNGSDPNDFILEFYSARRLGIYLAGATPSAGYLRAATACYNYDKYYFVGFTYNKSQLKIYSDGVLNVTIAAARSTDLRNAPVYFGLPYGNSNETFRGFLDDIFIFNKVLSADEVLSLYNATK